MGMKPFAFLFFALAGAVGMGAGMAACVGDDGTPPATVANDGGPEASILTQGKANGIPCAAGSECTSAQCSDGVCCDAKCDGTCEKCNLPGTVGTCSPIQDATDPDNECPTTPLDEDAGAPAGGDDGGADGGADGGDAGVVDAGPVFNVPDGGFPTVTTNQCAGHCNGKRACAYAGSETTCGTSFCGNTTEQGRASCDGAGHCLYGIEECSSYACPDGAAGCKTSCASSTDCLSTYYCDGPTSTCKPKLTNGTSCTNVTQCESGVCDSVANVCCNTPSCTTTPGGTCAKPGSIGTCTCSACAGSGGCALFYIDRDHDGYGDVGGTVGNGGAAYGCAVATDGAPPAGFVADHTDCFDSTTAVAGSVHPGQTGFFATAYTNGAVTSFDYNCSGQTEKQYPEAGCGFADFHAFVIQQFAMVSQPDFTIPGYCNFQSTCASASQQGGHSASGCTIDNDPGFQFQVACGTVSTSYTCGTCSAVGGSAPSTSAGTKTQGCH